jgi:acyl-[acyl-carrier-protein]-phospholipid O-acyltransferase/long-chain-fatty-acid--[acyl-carrier-protein] ligase
MKTCFHLLLRLFFRFRSYNAEILNAPGPVLLIPNHTSWLDWMFLLVCLKEDWKFVTSSTTAQKTWLHRLLMINRHTFPVDPASPYAVKRMAEYLNGGGKLVLFAEGRLSRTGTLMKLFDGTGFLLFKTQAKVITCYLRGAQRVPYSPHPGWKKLFTRVSAHFSAVFTPPQQKNVSTVQARATLTTWLRDLMVNQQFETEMQYGPANVFDAITHAARLRPNQIVLEDVTLQALTYRKLLIGADVLAQPLGKSLGCAPAGQNLTGAARIGVLLPNINATPVVLLALWRIGKVPAILNFSSGSATMKACAGLAGLKYIVTSRAFLERAKLQVDGLVEAGLVFIYLEDLRAGISGAQKFSTYLKHRLGLQTVTLKLAPDSAAVVLFTSGSEGVPKGVELSHRNLLANIRQMLAVADLTDDDRVFNCLPLFHSFGLSVGLLLPLVRGMYTFIYPSPLHYRVVPAAIYDRDCSVFLSTNTFLNGYARKAHPYDFRSMRYLFAAAEKLQEATAQVWMQKYGVRILEGYGATECAPCVSVNTPLAPRHGSVGRLLPGMDYRLEPVEGVGEGGRLFVRGPNVMKGYLNADANAKFQALGGWYDTGDIVNVDAEGFLHVCGRLKRFAKVSGEMVSLTAVEDALAGAFPQYGLRCQVAVITRPDEDKGEALIAVTNEPKLTLEEIREVIKAKGLTNLNTPRELKVVNEIPKLGTGKVNHRELQAQILGAK